MKIELSLAQIDSLLVESSTFRAIFIKMAAKNTLDYFREEIRQRFPRFQGDEKIAAIKWLREAVRGKIDTLREFDALNYEVYGNRGQWCENDTLGLAASKRFVESC